MTSTIDKIFSELYSIIQEPDESSFDHLLRKIESDPDYIVSDKTKKFLPEVIDNIKKIIARNGKHQSSDDNPIVYLEYTFTSNNFGMVSFNNEKYAIDLNRSEFIKYSPLSSSFQKKSSITIANKELIDLLSYIINSENWQSCITGTLDRGSWTVLLKRKNGEEESIISNNDKPVVLETILTIFGIIEDEIGF